MAFQNRRHYKERIYYEPLGSRVFKFPRGNLFLGFTLDINAEMDITGSPAVNVPDFQIARMIKSLDIVQGTNTIWQISGEGLALLFSKRRGVEAIDNAAIAGATGNNKKGRHFMNVRFAPDDALKPWDFIMDTRKYDYEMRIQFRDITAAGTFFASYGGGVAVTSNENFIDISLDQVNLRPGPTGAEDALTNSSPLMRGLFERTIDIVQTNNQFKLDLPKFKTFRTLSFWATHEANANQVAGSNLVFNDKIILKDTQEKEYLTELATNIRQDTGQRWGVSTLPAGFYEMPIAAYGAGSDALVSNNTTELYVLTSVAKQVNATAVRVYADTIEQQ